MFQSAASQLPIDRKWKTHVEIAPGCPRCSSSNTKFCYYNNYSLSQPRYFCKACRRYWTKGGSLRNVPVGGGCRKSRRANNKSSGKNNSGSSSVESVVQESGSNNSNNNNGSEIDLAVVFAKFLNQESSFQPEIIRQGFPHETVDQDLASLTDSLSPPDSETAVECKNLTDDYYYNFQQSNDLLQGYLVAEEQVQKQQQEERIEEIMIMESQETNKFGMQTLLGDEIMQESLWCEAETSLSNMTWKLPVHDQVQYQEFDSLSGDDRLNISTNLINDYAWGSSDDLSAGHELFSRSQKHNLQEFYF